MSIYSNYKIRYVHGLISSLLIFGCYLAQFYALHDAGKRSGHGSLWLILVNTYLIVAGVVYSFFIEWTQRMLYWSTVVGIKEEDSTLQMKAFDRRLLRRSTPLPLSRAELAYVTMAAARPVVMDGCAAVVVLLLPNTRHLAATLNSSMQSGPRGEGSHGNLLAIQASARPNQEKRPVPRLVKQESEDFVFDGVTFSKAESRGITAEDDLLALSTSGFARKAQLHQQQQQQQQQQRKLGGGGAAGKYEASGDGAAASAAATAAAAAATLSALAPGLGAPKVEAVVNALALINQAVARSPSAQISSILGNAVVIMVRPGRSIASSSAVAASIACKLLSLREASPAGPHDELHLAIGIASGDAICAVVPNGAAVGSRPVMAMGDSIDQAMAQAWAGSLERASMDAATDHNFVMASVAIARHIRSESESHFDLRDSNTAPSKSVRLTPKAKN
jgi:hypothetical protein